MSGEALPLALIALMRRNRRRYGGYTVHAGMAVLFIGVAASSSFKRTVDVSLSPGQSARVGDLRFDYVRPWSTLTAEKISLGATIAVWRGDRRVATLRSARGYYPSRDPALGVLGRFFEGEATSEVGLRSSVRRDLWSVIAPDISRLRPVIAQGDRRFAAALATVRPAPNDGVQTGRLFALRDLAIRGLAERWVRRPWPADFRFIVSPLVEWIWIGGLIVAGGGLFALWPARLPIWRRARATAPVVPAAGTRT